MSHLCTVCYLCTKLPIDEILYRGDKLYIDETIPVEPLVTNQSFKNEVNICFLEPF